MRTTLTLDDDVAVMVERIRKHANIPRRRLVNEALRRGLRQIEEPEPVATPFRVRPVSLGRCLLQNLDDTAEALAIAEGDDFR